METKSNKTIVLECYRKIIRDLDLSVIDKYVHNNYIQHSPTVKNGKAGLVEMLKFLKTLPKPLEIAPTPIVRVVADGDFVAVHLNVKFMGKQWAVIDLYRLADGMLAEHWDAGQEQPDSQDSLINMTNGSVVIEDSADATANKRLIAGLFDAKFQTITAHLTPGFTKHSLNDGIKVIRNSDYKLHRIIGEGNFVVTHSEVVGDERTFSRFNIFKLEDGFVAEHWSVQQQVPEVMAHSNRMF